jgi:CPA1 family monovalent cation:H+ antiporter
MSTLSIGAVLLCLGSLFGFINHIFLRPPTTIGLMIAALLASLGLVGANMAFLGLGLPASGREHADALTLHRPWAI